MLNFCSMQFDSVPPWASYSLLILEGYERKNTLKFMILKVLACFFLQNMHLGSLKQHVYTLLLFLKFVVHFLV